MSRYKAKHYKDYHISVLHNALIKRLAFRRQKSIAWWKEVLSVNGTEVLDIGRDAIYVLLVISAPVMLVSVVVGLVVALFQALTQIQEATLTFVPKIVAIFITLMVTLPFMGSTLNDFYIELMNRIAPQEVSADEGDV
jgi:flagellar biosynthesis protein FliQ